MATKTITFAARQEGVPSCGVVNLKFSAGDLRAEYESGSEVLNEDETWSYDFLVQEEDLPGAMTLDEVLTSNIVEPLWSCKAEDDAEEEVEECAARNAPCFSGLPFVEELEEGDKIGIFRLDPTCETYCLYLITPEDFKAALELLA